MPGGRQFVCQDESNVMYEIPAVAGAISYMWEPPPGAVVNTGSGTTTVGITFSSASQSGAVRVRAVNSCGEGPVSDDLLVTVNILPANAGTITATISNSQICRGPQLTSVAMGENELSYTVTLNACSVTDKVKVYNNKVLVSAGDNKVLCLEDVILEGSLPPAGTNGLWKVLSGSASLEDATADRRF